MTCRLRPATKAAAPAQHPVQGCSEAGAALTAHRADRLFGFQQSRRGEAPCPPAAQLLKAGSAAPWQLHSTFRPAQRPQDSYHNSNKPCIPYQSSLLRNQPGDSPIVDSESFVDNEVTEPRQALGGHHWPAHGAVGDHRPCVPDAEGVSRTL